MSGYGRRGWGWALGLLGLLTLVGCKDGPTRLELPGEGEMVAAFPTVDEESAQEEGPGKLEVTLTQPTGTIHTLQAINVAFNQPVIEPLEGPPVLSVEPPIEGNLRWLGQQTVSFIPTKPLPMATRFKVTVARGLRAESGPVLEEPVVFEFATPGLRVVRFDPSWYNARLRPDDTIFMQFNLPVSLDELKGALKMGTAQGLIELDVTPTLKDKGGDAVTEGTAFMIKPRGGFVTPRNTVTPSYTLYLSEKLMPQTGQLGLGTRWSHTFYTYESFAVKQARCGWNQCTPDAVWTVEFTNPVTASEIASCLQVRPRVEMSEPYGYNGSTYVTLRPTRPKPGTTYTLSLTASCKDDLGNTLGKAWSQKIAVGHYTPRIKLDGGINFMEKADKGQKPSFPVTLLNTPDLKVRMRRLDEKELSTFIKDFSSWHRGDSFGTLRPTVDRPFGVRLESDVEKTYAINLGEVLGNDDSGVVLLDVASETLDKAHGNSGSRYYKSMVQVTDLGLTAKYSPESVLIWVTSLSTARPQAGVRVAMRDEAGALLWEGTTDDKGMATGPGLKTFGTKKPRTIFASRGHELSFIDLESWGMQIMPWRFDMPYEWDAPAVALRGQIFTERGVYRPGESVHVKGYLRIDEGRQLALLSTDRAWVKVTDAQDNLVLETEVGLSDQDGFDLTVPVKEGAPLGTWSIEAGPRGDTSGAEGEVRGSFRVEAYRAPDFEVTVNPARKHVLVGEQAQVTISGQYLFGAPMRSAKVSWSARRRETQFSPSGYEGFEFGDLAGRYWWYDPDRRTSHVEDGQGDLDGAGLREATLTMAADTELKGPQELIVEASVQDVNRQVVAGQARVAVHPGAFYVGLKRPGYLVKSGDAMDIGLLAVTPEGEALSGQKVSVELLKREWTSVRKTMAGGGTTWVSEAQDTPSGRCEARTAGKRPATCQLTPATPGSYVLKATSSDQAGRAIETTVSLYAWGGGWSWWGASDDERIDLVVDKQRYKVGDKARIMVKSPFREASALVTVERRGILSQRTVTLRGSASTIEVPITEEMLPNAYVSVVLLRGRVNNPKDDGQTVDPGKPAFRIGYASLNIDRSAKVLDVAVKPAQEVWRPGQEVTAEVIVTDSQGKPTGGELTFMAVDEGVLSLTAYKTPDPVGAFYQVQPLAVVNAESRMAIVARRDAESEEGEKGIEGGGGGEGGQSTNYRSAFATTAAFMPTVIVGQDGRAQVRFKLPDNLTAYRLMAVVASTENRFGSGETRIKVQKPLMVRPALPRVASTGDDFAVRAVIQAVGEAAGQVRVKAEATGPVELVGQRETIITLGRGEAREVAFPVAVGAPGEARVRFSAVAVDGFEGDDAVEMVLPVRFPAVSRTRVITGVIQPQAGDGVDRVWKQISLPEGIRSDVGGLEIELSSSAMADLLPGLRYLVDYPYGCVEQTTGRTLPLVAMRALQNDISLPGIEGGDVTKYAQSGLDRLLSMQAPSGGLGYWPGDDVAHPWGSVYGGLALVLASRQDGLSVDEYKMERLVAYLGELLRDNVETDTWWRAEAMTNTRAFAAYVLAEADAAEPAYHARLFEQRAGLSDFGKGFLAMAIQRSGGDQTMVDTLLGEMFKGAWIEGPEAHLRKRDYSDYYWELMDSDVRSDAVALMALQLARPGDELSPRFARGLLNARRGGRWLSTQDNAFAVLALMDHFAATESRRPDFKAVVGLGEEVISETRFKDRAFSPRQVSVPMRALVDKGAPVLSLVRDGKAGPLYYTLRLSYAPAEPPTKAYDHGFTLRRQYTAAEGPSAGAALTRIKPGELVKIELTIVAPADRHYVAINDPLPAGLEPVNTSFATTAPSLADAVDAANDEDDWEWWWYPSHNFDRIEQRDDRLVLFADYLPAGVYTHTYLARATTPGTFTVPAAFAEEMYDEKVYGRTEAFTFEVK